MGGIQRREWIISRLAPEEALRNYATLLGHDGYCLIITSIEKGDISKLPCVIESKLAVKKSDTKGKATKIFSKVDAEHLPVVDDNFRFIGVISRGKLLSEVLTAVMTAAQS
jgi:hypothetical protein